MKTKLAMKMRALATRTRYPDKVARLNNYADQLDAARSALGDTMSRTGGTYIKARKLYCELTGREWEWGADHDLDLVE